MTRTKTKKIKMVSRPTSVRQARDKFVEADSTYFLKLVLIVILGTLWLKFATPMSWQGVPVNGIPIGLLVGLAGIRLFEKNSVDRKIWYAVLVVVTIITYFVPAGVVF